MVIKAKHLSISSLNHRSWYSLGCMLRSYIFFKVIRKGLKWQISPQLLEGRALRAFCLWREQTSISKDLRPPPHPRPGRDFVWLSYHPATSKRERVITRIKRWAYLPDSRWLITVEAVSMATSSLAAKAKWASHPISFEMAVARVELDLSETEFSCKAPNSARVFVFRFQIYAVW